MKSVSQSKYKYQEDEDDLQGIHLEKQYIKYKARDSKVQKRREREMDWYD